MRTIWKFTAPFDGEVRIDMPAGAQTLHATVLAVDRDAVLTVWAKVDTDHPTTTRTFHIRGTGHHLGDDVGPFVGTVIDGPFVWHIFEARHAPDPASAIQPLEPGEDP